MNIHVVSQGKGGVGKSIVAYLLAQYLNENCNGAAPTFIDTDPVNKTFTGFKALGVNPLQLIENDEINKRNFDYLIEQLNVTAGDIVVDNGASCFLPLNDYMLSNEFPQLVKDLGHQLIMHSIISGSDMLLHTVNGFKALAEHFPPETKIMVWLNQHWGPVEYDGKTFEQMKAFKDYKDRVSGIITLPVLQKDTFAVDFANMLADRQTFEERLNDDKINIAERQRIKIIKRKIWEQIDTAFLGLNYE